MYMFVLRRAQRVERPLPDLRLEAWGRARAPAPGRCCTVSYSRRSIVSRGLRASASSSAARTVSATHRPVGPPVRRGARSSLDRQRELATPPAHAEAGRPIRSPSGRPARTANVVMRVRIGSSSGLPPRGAERRVTDDRKDGRLTRRHGAPARSRLVNGEGKRSDQISRTVCARWERRRGHGTGRATPR